MSDPTTISLVSVGSVAISEGIKFFYVQAAELLKRYRDRKKGGDVHSVDSVAVDVEPPVEFDAKRFTAVVPMAAIETNRAALEGLLKELSGFAMGYADLDMSDERVLRHVVTLRETLESLYAHPLRFVNETRPEAPTVSVAVVAGDVDGQFTGLEAGDVGSGTVQMQAKLGSIGENGSATAVKLGNIGAVR